MGDSRVSDERSGDDERGDDESDDDEGGDEHGDERGDERSGRVSATSRLSNDDSRAFGGDDCGLRIVITIGGSVK